MRVSPCRKKKSEIINKHLTWGRVYRVIGIESDYYRIVDDQGMPVLFPPDWFNIIDDEEPKCWITSYSEDGDRYSYPNELNAVGFFEDWHNEDAEARRVFREYLSKYLMDIVCNLKVPHFLYVESSHSDLTNKLWYLQNKASERAVVRVFRGTRMLTEQGGFDEISAASQFPYYFGNNWDALDECINDLEWMPADNYVFVFFDFDVILREWEPETVEILLRVFHDAAIEWSVPVKIGEAWDRDAKPFHIIFHQERNADIEVLQSIKKYGYEIRQIL